MEQLHDVRIPAEIVEIALDPQRELVVLFFELVRLAHARLSWKRGNREYFEERADGDWGGERIDRIG